MLITTFLMAAWGEPASEAPAEQEAVPTGPVTYVLDGKSSFLGVLVRYDRDALVRGHDHVVAPSSFTGKVTWSDDLSACDVSIRFPVSKLQVDPAGARERFALDGTTSDGDKKSIKKNLSGKHQLDADVFPEIRFQSSGCVAKGDAVAVSGTLTLHGVGAPVTAMMKVDATPEAFTARGSFEASHATWSMDPFTALLGSLRNDEALAFTIDAMGSPE